MTNAKFIVVSDGPMREFETLHDVLIYVNENGGDIYEPLTTEAARQVCVIENQADEIEHLLAEGDEREEAARWLLEWIETSQWTHLTEDDRSYLARWSWLVKDSRGAGGIADRNTEIDRLRAELRVEHDIMLTKQEESDLAHAEIERLRAERDEREAAAKWLLSLMQANISKIRARQRWPWLREQEKDQ